MTDSEAITATSTIYTLDPADMTLAELRLHHARLLRLLVQPLLLSRGLGLALGDASPLVRHHALLLVSQLLLEKYVKWNPTLLRCLAVAVVRQRVPPRIEEPASLCKVETELEKALQQMADLLATPMAEPTPPGRRRS